MLSELKEALSEKPIEFTFSEDVPSYLAEKAEGGSRGARDLRNIIRKEIEDEVATIIIDSSDDPVRSIYVEVKEGKLNISSI